MHPSVRWEPLPLTALTDASASTAHVTARYFKSIINLYAVIMEKLNEYIHLTGRHIFFLFPTQP